MVSKPPVGLLRPIVIAGTMLIDSVDGQSRTVSYKEWADLIQVSFEKCYYVPSDPTQDKDFNINTALVNRRGIYKDVYGTPKDREWSDYQVR